MTTAIYAPATQLGIDSVSSLASVTKRFNFIEANIVDMQKLEDMNALRGTLSRNVAATRPGVEHIGGNIRLQPTGNELALLLPWMMNGTPSGSSYPLANSTTTRFVAIDRSNYTFGGSDGKVFGYPSCAVDSWTLKAAKGGIPLELDLSVVGLTESVNNNGSFPTGISLDTSSTPFLFTDLVFSLNGSNWSVEDVEISGHYAIDRERFFNSLTLTGTYATDRIITCKTHIPYAGAEALYAAGSGGLACVATFTNAGNNAYVLTMTAGTAVYTKDTPPIRGRSEVLLPVSMQFYQSGSTPELATTLAV